MFAIVLRTFCFITFFFKKIKFKFKNQKYFGRRRENNIPETYNQLMQSKAKFSFLAAKEIRKQ